MKASHTFHRSIFNTVLFAAIFLAVIISPQAYSHGQEVEKSAEAVADAAKQKNQAKDLTDQLGNLISRYTSVTEAEKPSLAGQLAGLAEERRQLLGKLIENDPAEVLRQALPDDVLDQMPVKAHAFLEQRVELEGELQLLHVDYKDQSQSHYVYLLSANNGERYSLHFAKNEPDIQSSARVRVNGLVLYDTKIRDAGETEGAMVLEDGGTSLELLEAGGSGNATINSSTTSTATVPNSLGEQRTLVIMVNFKDKPADKPWTSTDVYNAFFSSTSGFISENSYGQAWLGGKVYGWYTINLDSTSCDTMQIESGARTAATAAGVDLSAYSHHIYVFPTNSNCGFSGTSTVGGNPSRTWINGDIRLKIVGHEFGHAMGLYHSHSLACEGSTIGTDCPKVEYGDGIDVMGWSPTAHFNTVQKERLGWLNNGTDSAITTVLSNGTFVLEPYENASSSLKALKLYKGLDPATGKEVDYYIEYRQSIGFDTVIDSSQSLMNSANILNGVVVHMGSPTMGGNAIYLLDMTPETFDSFTRDPALVAGRTYTDPAAGIAITTNWVNGSGASVSVSFSTSTSSCAHANPFVSVSSPSSQSVASGTSVDYTVNVTNNDSSACSQATFALGGNVPSGWTSVLSNSVLTLNPGASGTVTLTVTSPISATDGSYNIGVKATNSNVSAYAGSGGALYTISNNSANQAPVAVDDSAITVESSSVDIPVMSNDWDPNGDSLTVKSVTQGAHGAVSINSNSTIHYVPEARFRGSDSFSYTITDGSGTASGSVAVTVKRSSGKSK